MAEDFLDALVFDYCPDVFKCLADHGELVQVVKLGWLEEDYSLHKVQSKLKHVSILTKDPLIGVDRS